MSLPHRVICVLFYRTPIIINQKWIAKMEWNAETQKRRVLFLSNTEARRHKVYFLRGQSSLIIPSCLCVSVFDFFANQFTIKKTKIKTTQP